MEEAYKKSACSVDPKTYEPERIVTPEICATIFPLMDQRLIDILHLTKLLTDNKDYLNRSDKNAILDKLYIARELLNQLVNVYDD